MSEVDGCVDHLCSVAKTYGDGAECSAPAAPVAECVELIHATVGMPSDGGFLEAGNGRRMPSAGRQRTSVRKRIDGKRSSLNVMRKTHFQRMSELLFTGARGYRRSRRLELPTLIISMLVGCCVMRFPSVCDVLFFAL